MAHYKKKRSRTRSAGYYSANGLARRLKGRVKEQDILAFYNRYPRHWDKNHHIRPTRRDVAALEHAVIRGADADDLVWPDGRKPHVYYW